MQGVQGICVDTPQNTSSRVQLGSKQSLTGLRCGNDGLGFTHVPVHKDECTDVGKSC